MNFIGWIIFIFSSLFIPNFWLLIFGAFLIIIPNKHEGINCEKLKDEL